MYLCRCIMYISSGMPYVGGWCAQVSTTMGLYVLVDMIMNIAS